MVELIWLAVILFVWSAAGHLVWVGVRWILRELLGDRCSVCEKVLTKGVCLKCRLAATAEAENAKPSVRQDLKAAKRLLQYVRFNHWLQSAEIAELERQLHVLETRIAEPRPTEVLSATAAPESAGANPGANPVVPPQVESAPMAAKSAESLESPPVMAATIVSPPAQVHPLDQEIEAAAPPRAQVPLTRRLSADLLQSFMEQSNIRWVELISASLIVICSVGLVISLWNTLSATSRFFPSLVFLLGTLAVHGAGQYTLRQWKLRSTSRGILHIGLMLIPLSVLVGLLLARRDATLPSWDWPTATAILIGTVVYGSLTIVTCRTLFSHRWWMASSVLIVACVTLLPIHFAARYEVLHQPWVAACLIPLALCNGIAAAWLSRYGRRVGHCGSWRRTVGILTQCLVPTGICLGFWLTLIDRSQDLTARSWLPLGLISASWLAWGVSIHLRSSELHAASSVIARKVRSGFLTIAWLIAALCGLLLPLCLWNAGEQRLPLIGLLLMVGGLWWLHGQVCRLAASSAAGVACGLFAIAFLIELPFTYASQPTLADWLSLTRVLSLTAVGGLSLGMLAGSQLLGWGNIVAMNNMLHPSQQRSTGRLATGGLPTGGLSIAAVGWAGGGMMVLASLLTVLATLSPLGLTPYGGQWSGWLLLCYGAVAMALSVVSYENISRTEASPGSSSGVGLWGLQWIMPVGQALWLLAAIRLVMVAPGLSPMLEQLPTIRRWGVGAAMLAACWAWLAATLRGWSPQSQRFNIGALSVAAVPLAALAAVVVWTHPDRGGLAAMWGWALPLAFYGVAWSWRGIRVQGLPALEVHMRELTLVTSGLWWIAVGIQIGEHFEWWSQSSLFASSAILVAMVVPAVMALDQLLLRLTPIDLSSNEDQEQTLRSEGWGSNLLIVVGWLTLLFSGAIPCLHAIVISLGYTWQPSTSPWLTEGLTTLQFVVAAFAVGMLTIFSVWNPRRAIMGAMTGEMQLVPLAGLAPLLVAMGTLAWLEPPYGLPTAMWLLATALVLAESLWQWTAGSKSWLGQLAARFGGDDGLLFGGVLAAVLLMLSSAYCFACLATKLPPELMPAEGSWGSNFASIMLCLGPILMVATTRWWWSLIRGHDAKLGGGIWWSAGTAMLSSFFVAIAIVLANPQRLADGSYPVIDSLVVFLLGLATALAAHAWLSLGNTLGRNVLALRSMAGGNASPLALIGKGMRGGRFRLTQQSTQPIAIANMVTVAILSALACLAVVTYPIQALSGLGWLGSNWMFATLLVSFPLAWVFLRRDGASKLGLVTVAFGVAAPVVCASYANWLELYPSWRVLGTSGFEPWRLLIVLWLISLSITLAVRIVIAIRGSSVTPGSDVAWLLLAAGVGTLALVGVRHDPDAIWPATELVVLAVLTCLCGVVAGQHARGHIAAVLASAGVACGLAITPPTFNMIHLWSFLWGSVLISVVSFGVRRYWVTWLQKPEAVDGSVGVTVERSTSLLAPIASMLLTLFWILALQWIPTGTPPAGLWSILGLAFVMFALAIARLWEPRIGQRGLGVYLSALNLFLVAAVVIAWTMEVSRLHAQLLWLTGLLTGMALMAALLRELCREASAFRHQLKLTGVTDAVRLDSAMLWMPAVHNTMAYLALLPCCWLVFSLEEQTLRIAATALPLLGAAAVLPIATRREQATYRYAGLFFGSASLLFLFWAQLPDALFASSGIDSWMFVQRGFVACAVLTFAHYLLAMCFRSSERWVQPLTNSGWIWCGVGILAGVVMLAPIAIQFPAGVNLREYLAQLPIAEKLLTMATWVFLAARLLLFAVRPQAAEAMVGVELRKGAVFLAEFALLGFGLATYSHFPDLFQGLFLSWWPVIVLGLAMFSVGLGEWLRRLNQTVLADPIQQSSLLLPIIPLAGVWWYTSPDVQWIWNQSLGYSLLLISAAAVYASLGWARNSVVLRGVAGTLVLLSFWSLLQHYPNLRFIQHPQFWLLPPCVAALAFIEAYRQRLDARTLTAARYVLLLVAYLSSTSEVLLRAFEGQLWQPMVLLALSLVGIGLGIALRVKAFMLCGSVFTFVALLGMVWHAQQAIGQVWPWWVFGIATGIGLLVCLGYFEKNRDQLQLYLKHWGQWEN